MKKILIDVSEHQGKIDWKKVKPQIDGAILRCGYGSDYTNQDDEQFKRNANVYTPAQYPDNWDIKWIYSRLCGRQNQLYQSTGCPQDRRTGQCIGRVPKDC